MTHTASESARTVAWDDSYDRNENHVWYPHDEMVRFLSRYVRKRIDVDRFQHILSDGPLRGLDFGCGIGRGVFLLDDFGIEAHGVDISRQALKTAKRWADHQGRGHLADRFRLVDPDAALDFPDGHFDVVVSHGVLDSMPFALARAKMRDIARVLRPGGVLYLDLISGFDTEVDTPDGVFTGEVVVRRAFEHGTIQSYFDQDKIQALVAGCGLRFRRLEHLMHVNLLEPAHVARFHMVLERSGDDGRD